MNRRKNKTKFNTIPIERLPLEVTIYHIFRFLPPLELFESIQLVSRNYRNLVWNSLRNSRFYTDRIIVIPEIMEKLEEKFKSFEADRNSLRRLRPKKAVIKQIRKNFRFPLPLFCKLCKTGAVNLAKYGHIIFEYLYRIIRLSYLGLGIGYSNCGIINNSARYDHKPRILSTILRAMQTVVDYHPQKSRIEAKDDTELRKSYFHQSYTDVIPRLIKFFLQNREVFRIPDDEESVRYIEPYDVENTGVWYDRMLRAEEVLTYLKYYSSDKVKSGVELVTQELFEKYISLRTHQICPCCDNDRHYHEIMKFVINSYCNNNNNNNHHHHHQEDRKICITKECIEELLKVGVEEGFTELPKKIELIQKFINQFGVASKMKIQENDLNEKEEEEEKQQIEIIDLEEEKTHQEEEYIIITDRSEKKSIDTQLEYEIKKYRRYKRSNHGYDFRSRSYRRYFYDMNVEDISQDKLEREIRNCGDLGFDRKYGKDYCVRKEGKYKGRRRRKSHDDKYSRFKKKRMMRKKKKHQRAILKYQILNQ